MGQSPHLILTMTPQGIRMLVLLTNEQTDLTELTSQVTHFQGRMQRQI